jgi:hypothetical protein
MEFVERHLSELAELFKERNGVYKDNYKTIGDFLNILFPKGLSAKTPEEFNRLCVMVNIVGKLTRYCANWQNGHEDSLNDLSVYAAMLQELDHEYYRS